MDKKQKQKAKIYTSIFSSFWTILVNFPLWAAFLYGIMQALGDNAPPWLWFVFYFYLPANLIGLFCAFLIGFITAFADDE